ncbi:MAG: glutathione S-transferase family protein [Gammaproteobacteria bacterium]|nr:glutathione S-transferase family protein [Gammaproteobacteria bacterium]
MNLELISFKLCPFVQSSVITLLHKGIEHKITFIDINDPPQWFDELSPTGQVPILRVDNDTVIFESAVINEFLNDAGGCGMMPDDPLQRALHRAWIQFCGSILGDMFNLVGAGDKEGFEDIEYDILEKLDRLEAIKSDSACFSGGELSLIDTLYSGLFMRLDLLKPARDILDASRYPRLAAWSQHLLGLDPVQNSVVPEFSKMYLGMVKMREGYISQSL